MAIENSVSSSFYLYLSIVLTFLIAAYPVCHHSYHTKDTVLGQLTSTKCFHTR